MARTCALILVSIVALVAGGAAIWAAATLARPIAVDAEVTTARRDTALAVARFYAAANERLDSGGLTALRAATTPDFAFQAAPFPDAGGLAAFDRFLGDLDDACDDCLLSVDRVVIESDTVSVILTAWTTAQANAHGLPVSGPLIVWTGHDLLRVEGGLVSEYRGQAAAPAAVRPLISDIFLNIPTGLAVVDVVHLSMAQGASLTRAGLHVSLHVVVESGALDVEIGRAVLAGDGPSGPANRVGGVLGPREHIAIPPEHRFALWNAGASPVSAWVVSLRPFDPRLDGDRSWSNVEPWLGDLPAGVRQRGLGTAAVSTYPGGQFALTLGRLTLGAGAIIDPHEVAGAEIVSVGAGVLEVTVTGDDARLVRGADVGRQRRWGTGAQGEALTAAATLDALDTAVIHGGEVAARNVGPAPVGLVVLLIVPADANRPAS